MEAFIRTTHCSFKSCPREGGNREIEIDVSSWLADVSSHAPVKGATPKHKPGIVIDQFQVMPP